MPCHIHIHSWRRACRLPRIRGRLPHHGCADPGGAVAHACRTRLSAPLPGMSVGFMLVPRELRRRQSSISPEIGDCLGELGRRAGGGSGGGGCMGTLGSSWARDGGGGGTGHGGGGNVGNRSSRRAGGGGGVMPGGRIRRGGETGTGRGGGLRDHPGEGSPACDDARRVVRRSLGGGSCCVSKNNLGRGGVRYV